MSKTGMISVPCALIVDDDPVLQLAVQQCMNRLGFETLIARDGKRGLEWFRRQPVDIILLDAAMPVMDGFTACKAIRELPNGSHVPIIMITVYDDEQSVDRAFQAGANEYVTKPIHWAVLRNRVLQLVASARAEGALRNDRAFFQSLVDSMPDPTVVCDPSCTVRWINASAQANQELYEPEIDNPFRLKPGVRDPDDPESAPEKLAKRIRDQVAQGGSPLDLLLHKQSPDGSQMFAELHASPLRDVSGGAQGVILRFHDVTARELEGRWLRHEVRRYGKLAYHDSLTGLANRRLFEQSIHEAIVDGARFQQRHALLFIDLDEFKAINDSLGHQGGDEALKLLAERLQCWVRRRDAVYRIGGDEFAVLLREVAEPEGIAVLAQKLLDVISEPMILSRGTVRLGASIGISLYPEHADTASDLIKYADEAMYQVKDAGKASIRIFGTREG